MPNIEDLEREQLRDDLERLARTRRQGVIGRAKQHLPFAKVIARRRFLKETVPERVEAQKYSPRWRLLMQIYAAEFAVVALRNGITPPTLKTQEVLERMEGLGWRQPTRGHLLPFRESVRRMPQNDNKIL